MKRQKPPIQPVAVHDHFDGSAHCVQCGGICMLTGAEKALTEMIRWRMEAISMAHGLGLNMMELGTLKRIGVDVEAFMARARETRDLDYVGHAPLMPADEIKPSE